MIAGHTIKMAKTIRESRVSSLELQLEEALQMLRLVAQNKRTCMEVEEWLSRNHPTTQDTAETMQALLGSARRKKA